MQAVNVREQRRDLFDSRWRTKRHFFHVCSCLKSQSQPSVRYVASAFQIPSMSWTFARRLGAQGCPRLYVRRNGVERACVQTPCATHGRLSQLCTLGRHTGGTQTHKDKHKNTQYMARHLVCIVMVVCVIILEPVLLSLHLTNAQSRNICDTDSVWAKMLLALFSH